MSSDSIRVVRLFALWYVTPLISGEFHYWRTILSSVEIFGAIRKLGLNVSPRMCH